MYGKFLAAAQVTRARIGGVDVVHWNPRRNSAPFPLSVLPVGRRVDNFGDLLGPMIVARLHECMGGGRRAASPSRRLLSVGSIMSMARGSDIVWGTGVNGKVALDAERLAGIDVRAVRGPLSARALEGQGVAAPDIYGDPALLLPELFPEWSGDIDKTREIGLVPNLHDLRNYASHPDTISPIGAPSVVIGQILRSERIVASSLHGVIIAEAFGIPAVMLVSKTEPPFKYRDYYEGTGRNTFHSYRELATAFAAARVKSPVRLDETWDGRALREAFPVDLWGGATR